METKRSEMCHILCWLTLVTLIFEGEGKQASNHIFNQDDSLSHDESEWYLLGIERNSTLNQKKPEVSIETLTLFVEKHTGIRYHQITINSVSLSPNTLVNFSINALSPRVAREPHWEHNSTKQSHPPSSPENFDTPLSLTSNYFNVTFFRSASGILHQKVDRESVLLSEEKKISLLYVAVGAILVIIICCCIVTTIFLMAMKHDKKKSQVFSSPFGRFNDPTQTIFSDHLNNDQTGKIPNESYYSGPIDDNLQPVEVEMDFTPAYIKQEDQKSFMSDRSIGESCNIELNISCEEPDRMSTPSKSPFYDSQYNSTPRSTSSVSCQSQNINNKRRSIARNGKKPPPPPSRTDSLDPMSRINLQSPNTHIELRKTSVTPTRKVRRYSAPAPRPKFPISSSSCRPTSSASEHITENSYLLQTPMEKEVTEEEVQSILENLGVN